MKKKKGNGEQGTCGSLWSSINNQIFWFLFHMTEAMLSDIAGLLQPNLLHQRQPDKYSSSKTPRHLPTLFLKGTLPTSPIHISLFFTPDKILQTIIPSVSHHFQSQIQCSLTPSTHHPLFYLPPFIARSCKSPQSF